MWYVITAEVDYLNSSNYEYYTEYSNCIDGFGKMTFIRNANSEEEAIFKLKQLNYFNFNKILSVKEYPDNEIKLVEKAKSELSNFNSFQLPRNPRYTFELIKDDKVLIPKTFVYCQSHLAIGHIYINSSEFSDESKKVLKGIHDSFYDFSNLDCRREDGYKVVFEVYSEIGDLLKLYEMENVQFAIPVEQFSKEDGNIQFMLLYNNEKYKDYCSLGGHYDV